MFAFWLVLTSISLAIILLAIRLTLHCPYAYRGESVQLKIVIKSHQVWDKGGGGGGGGGAEVGCAHSKAVSDAHNSSVGMFLFI